MELLRTDPQVKIYEVAEAVGYDSVSHFSRIFKRETGMSPKDYQQQRHGI
jgi:two-component system response regulator YesN